MITFPTGSRKTNISDLQEVSSDDLNNISLYLHQIIKDRSVNFFQSQQSGFSYPGCIINGCELSVAPAMIGPSAGTLSVGISSGLILFSATTDPDNYSGSLFPVAEQVIDHVAYPSPGASIMYAVDIAYTEVPDTVNTGSRNYYTAPTDLVKAKYTPIQIVPSYTLSLTAGAEVSSPDYATVASVASGYNRVAVFIATTPGSSGAIPTTTTTYTLPYVWNLQDWPGTTHSLNSATTYTLADSLSAIRAELAAIVGKTNWYDKPDTDLTLLGNRLTAAQAELTNLPLWISGLDVLTYDATKTNPQIYTVPANCYKIYIKAWGNGGNGGYGFCRYDNAPLPAGFFIYNWGGGGGSGSYIEDTIQVTPGQQIPYYVSCGGSSQVTFFQNDFAPGGGNGTSAGDGTEGIGGAGGIAGPANSTALKVNGAAGSTLGYGEGVGAFNMPFCSYKAITTTSYRAPTYGCGAAGNAGVVSGPYPASSPIYPSYQGGNGLILVYHYSLL